jgi:hypothetical protein
LLLPGGSICPARHEICTDLSFSRAESDRLGCPLATCVPPHAPNARTFSVWRIPRHRTSVPSRKSASCVHTCKTGTSAHPAPRGHEPSAGAERILGQAGVRGGASPARANSRRAYSVPGGPSCPRAPRAIGTMHSHCRNRVRSRSAHAPPALTGHGQHPAGGRAQTSSSAKSARTAWRLDCGIADDL